MAFGALALLYALLCEFLIAREGRISPEEWDRQEQERRVREGVEQAAKMRAIYGALNAGIRRSAHGRNDSRQFAEITSQRCHTS